jgi:hypothetical protein
MSSKTPKKIMAIVVVFSILLLCLVDLWMYVFRDEATISSIVRGYVEFEAHPAMSGGLGFVAGALFTHFFGWVAIAK